MRNPQKRILNILEGEGPSQDVFPTSETASKGFLQPIEGHEPSVRLLSWSCTPLTVAGFPARHFT
jgi:hypothetical protein